MSIDKYHRTSQHVLSLAPEVLLKEEALRPVRVNLLLARSAKLLVNPEGETAIDTAHDLSLSDQEVREQLSEAMLAHHGWSKLTLPLDNRTELESLAAPKIEVLTYAHEAFKPFEINVLIPQSPPENIFDYFDLPEDDGVKEESDIITLEEIETEEIVEETFSSNEDSTSVSGKRWSLPQIQIPQLLPANGALRAVASFVILSFVIVLPLHATNVVQDLKEARGQIELSSQEGVSLLSSAAQAALGANANGALTDFARASSRFDQATETIEELGAGTQLLLSALPLTRESYNTGEALINVGEELSIAGSRLAEGYQAMERELQPTLVSRLNIFEAYLSSALPHLESAQEALMDVEVDAVPEAYQEKLALLQTGLPAITSSLEEFLSFYDVVASILGADGSKRYLVIFQNNTEIRPTGGFIGSFAELKVYDGQIEQLNVPAGGAYDLQGAMHETLIPPKPLQLLSEQWEFQDGNWFPDFPTSARQLMQFYRDAGGPSVDGVLAVNATFVAELIGLLGPIQMPEYGRVIDQENFIFEAQRIVELEYDREENKPKAFIGDLAPKLVDRAIQKTSEDFLQTVEFLNQGLSQKDLQLYMADDTLQREILSRGWGGEIKTAEQDYLMVVDTNLGGGKTDGVISQKVDVRVVISESGEITNTVTISRTHYGIQGLLFTGVNNVDYLRVYVPKGSELLFADGFSVPDQSLFESPSIDAQLDDDLTYAALTRQIDPASGTEITQEHGKTVFGNWVQTKPGTTSTVTFRYTLPFTIDILSEGPSIIDSIKGFLGLPATARYSLTVQKQSGVIDRTTNVTINAPESLKTLWSTHGQGEEISNQEDALVATLFETL